MSDKEESTAEAGNEPAVHSGNSRLLRSLTWPLLAFAALIAFNFFFTPNFFHIEIRDGRLFGSLIDVMNRGAPVVLLAMGMTLVIATGGIDLSVGAIMAITGAMAAGLIARPPYSWLSAVDMHGIIPLIIVVSLMVSVGAGAWNGLLVSRLGIQPIVATLILMVAGRGIAQLITNGQIITFENPAFEVIGSGFLFHLPVPIFIALAVMAVAAIATRATALGLFIEAVGNNPTASYYAGISARRVKMIAYTFCGLCSGIAGLIIAADIKGADANNAGLYMELDAILAVAIGGTSLAGGRFTLIGSLIGALLIQTLTTTILTTTIIAKGIPPAVTLVVKAIVVIAVCLLQSERFRALFAKRGGRKSS
ncbi:MAG: ABC transporter permease [bacterium]